MTDARQSAGPRPELKWLPVKCCVVDHRYQRTLDSDRSKALIERIARSFRWSAFQAVLATPSDTKGVYLLIDGQHRAAAAKLAGFTEIPAVVVAADSIAEQAAAFVQANLDRVAVNPFALHHARLVAGDETALAIDRVCRATGISIPKYQLPADRLAPGQTLALGTIGQMVKRLGERGAQEVLGAIAAAYPDQAGCIRASLLRAAAGLYQGGASAAERTRSLARVTAWLKTLKPADLFGKAMTRRGAYGGTEADNIVAVIKAGIGGGAVLAQPIAGSAIKPPTREQLMGRR